MSEHVDIRIPIPRELHSNVKVAAARARMSLRAFVTEALEDRVMGEAHASLRTAVLRRLRRLRHEEPAP